MCGKCQAKRNVKVWNTNRLWLIELLQGLNSTHFDLPLIDNSNNYNYNSGSDNHQDLTIYSTQLISSLSSVSKSNWNLKFGTLAFHHSHRQAAPKMKLPLICSSHSLFPILYLREIKIYLWTVRLDFSLTTNSSIPSFTHLQRDNHGKPAPDLLILTIQTT